MFTVQTYRSHSPFKAEALEQTHALADYVTSCRITLQLTPQRTLNVNLRSHGARPIRRIEPPVAADADSLQITLPLSWSECTFTILHLVTGDLVLASHRRHIAASALYREYASKVIKAACYIPFA